MRHNYKLTDFKRMEGETYTDLGDIHVYIELKNLLELPSVVEKRFENMINNLIAEYEEKTNTSLSLEDMELGANVEIRKDSGELAIGVYIGYSIDEECLCAEECIKQDDEQYAIIRKIFFVKLNEYISEEIKKLEDCLQ